MIRLGLRLTVNGGREALVRLIITSLAVGLGVGMLLIALAGVNGVNSQNKRYAWLDSKMEQAPHGQSSSTDPAWWNVRADEFDAKIIGRVDVAATGPHSPVPPGILHLPGPGQFYASPAMTRLLQSTPAPELAARYPGHQIGTIGNAALPAPDSLLVVVGHTPAELASVPGARHITAINTAPPSSCSGEACLAIGIDAKGIDLILSVAIAALLFPVFIFIGRATRLSAARREQRFAAMRLVGATPRQVATISAVESTVAACIGVVLGFVAFVLLRPALAQIPFTGQRFFLSDLSLNLTQILVVALGVPVVAAVAARVALRRVSISPLGVSRRVTPPAPRAWRLIPVSLGLGELYWFVLVGRPATTPGQTQAYVSAILLTMGGLVLAGPWLSFVGARLVARRTNRPAVLIAGRRLADNPQAGFRAVSGLVLALFVSSTAIGVITTIAAYDGGALQPSAARILVSNLTDYSTKGPPKLPSTVPTEVVDQLSRVGGVISVLPVHSQVTRQSFTTRDGRHLDGGFTELALVSCAQLSHAADLGRCPTGAAAAQVPPEFSEDRALKHFDQNTVWPASAVSAAALDALPIKDLVLDTDGSQRAIEASRTILEQAYPALTVPGIDLPATIAERNAQQQDVRLKKDYEQVVTVVVLSSLVVAGCSLAVSVVTGLTDRKRPFSLLRLAGAPLAMLRRVLVLETVVSLLILAVVSVATGLLAAGLFLASQLQESLQAPPASFWITVLAGIVASLAVTSSTLPMLDRITGPEVARNE